MDRNQTWVGEISIFFYPFRKYIINDKNIKPHKMYRKKGYPKSLDISLGVYFV